MKKILKTGTLAMAVSLAAFTTSCGRFSRRFYDFLWRLLGYHAPECCGGGKLLGEEKRGGECDNFLLFSHAGQGLLTTCDSLGGVTGRQFD